MTLRPLLGALGALLLLGGCEFVDKTLLPAATGEFPNRVPEASAAPSEPAPVVRQPLVVIRFDQPNVDYQAILRSAIAQALERRPNAAFDVVAVAPSAGNAEANAIRTRRYAEEVFRSLIAMGLPPERLSIGATSSAQLQVDEVHVYVR